MMSRRQFESVLATILLLPVCFLTAAAQDSHFNDSSNPTSPAHSDPPGRVARVQYMSGEVSIQPGGVNDWVAASLNRPLTTADRVWTDTNSKAELSVGGGYIRLNSEASLTLTNVSDQTVQLQLDQGTLELTVRYLGPGQIYEVDTANLAFTVMKPGVYRFDVFPQEDATWVTVRKGQGEATGRGAAVKVKSGQQARFGEGASLQHTAEAAPPPDGFDDWASIRDKRLETSVSAQYVAPGVIGYEDLDSYGTWQTTAPYGAVWVPSSVPVGWAPYRFGHWVWIAPWGWTWVDNAPWGFAPFHYGRWVHTGGYWGWAPGPYRYWSPCYAPALVAWVGGPGWGTGFGFGGAGWGVGVNFGWFPLGWGEPFYPWYRGYGRGLSPTYIRNVNVTNTYITNVTNITNNYYSNHITNLNYANKTVRGAVTAAPGSAIAGGQPMNHFGQVLPSSALIHAPVARTVALTPTQSAMLGGAVRDRALPPPSGAVHSAVTHAPPPMTVGRGSVPAAGTIPVASSPPIAGAKPIGIAPPVVHRPPTMAEGRTFVPAGNSFAMHPAASTSAAASEVHPAPVVGKPAVDAARVPRPPADYTYRPAPGYTGATRTESGLTITGGSVGNGYAPANRAYSAAPAYNAHGSYSAAAPYTGSSHGAGAAGGHVSPPGMGTAPHYSPSGGAVHVAAPSNGASVGGSSHAMHGSGGDNKNR